MEKSRLLGGRSELLLLLLSLFATNRPHASPFVILSYFSSCRFIWMTLLFELVEEDAGRERAVAIDGTRIVNPYVLTEQRLVLSLFLGI